MRSSNPYIPAKDGDFNNWLLNFSTLLTATPALYGVAAADALIVETSYDEWNAAYVRASSANTRTSAAIAAKDEARFNAEAVVRPYAQQIKADQGVTDPDKVALGLNLKPLVSTVIPAPTSTVALSFVANTVLRTRLGYKDMAAPDGKAKPYGVIGVELFAAVAATAAVSPGTARYVKTITKSPAVLDWAAEDVGKVCTLYARYTTKGGPGGEAQKGPWSAPLTFSIT